MSGLGIVHAALGRANAAEAPHREALRLRSRLAQDYPGAPAYRQGLAASHQSLGRLLAASGRVKEAHTHYDQALALRKVLAKDLPTVPGFRQELADSYEANAALDLQLAEDWFPVDEEAWQHGSR